MEKRFQSIRKQYVKGALSEILVDNNPLRQLEFWLNEAILAECIEPTAMVLSTVGSDMMPSSRVVLMKGLDLTGIVFYTNYESLKGKQLNENPQASLLFFWPDMERQVRVQGTVRKVTDQESDEYFESRPEASRISAIVSPQSSEIIDREWLIERSKSAFEMQMGSQPGNRPSNWGGYRLIPNYFEFWQGREDRLHDRIVYQYVDNYWRIFRLAP
jgi:pyridoxamine-phosphate oxidase